MLLKFSNELDCDDESNSKNKFNWDCCCKCLKMRRNMMDLMLRQELNSEEQFLTKSNSQKHLDIPKKSKKDKKENKKEEIIKNHNDNIYKNLISQNQKNEINKDKSNEKKPISKVQEINAEINNIIDSKNQDKNNKINNIDISNQKNNDKFIKEDKKQDEINDKNIKKNSLDLNADKNEIKLSESDNNVKSISNNPISNFFGIGNNMNISPLNQFETFSVDSENGNAKNNKKKSTSYHSSSSLKKNFVLKTDIYKSEKQKGIYNKKYNYSDNPIMNYYSGNHFSNFANFYMADIKSPEEIDENNYLNFFPTKEKPEENNLKEKDYKSHSSIDNKRKDIKESNNIFEEDNIDDKLNLEKLTLVNTDSLEKKLNLDFINNSSSLIDENSNNNQIEIKDSIINNNNKGKIINDMNIQNDNFNNINNKNDFMFPLSNNQINNNNNYINFDINNINNFNNINEINNKNIINNDINNINNQNQNSFNFDSNNNNNFFNIKDINNLKEIKFSKEFFDELSNIDINKINLNIQNINNYQIPNNYFIPNDSSNMAFKYIKYNENGINSSGLPSGKSFYEYTEEDFLKYAIPLIKDQSGCRFLQEKIKTEKSFMEDKLFPSIKDNLFELGCDAFGNYFLQALLDIFSIENLNLFLDLIKNDFKNMCINQHGTRVIQKIIDKVSQNENLSKKLENILNSEDLGLIIKSPYGNHIIQKFIVSIHFKELTKFIYDYVLFNFMNVAESKHGVCVIQKCVSEGDLEQREKLYDLILQNFDELIKDEFGNYLIQYILMNIKSKEQFYEVGSIIKKIEDNLISICKFKFSANVIEKCLENGDNYIKQYLVGCILNRYRENVIELLLDQYGIYIIQKGIKLNAFYRNKFFEIIKEKKDKLNNVDFNDFKYRGAQKVLNSFKDFGLFFQNPLQINKEINNNYAGNYNNFNNYNIDYRNNYNNNKRKSKRGKKNYRGK